MIYNYRIVCCQSIPAVSGYENLGKIIAAVQYEITAPNGGKYQEWLNVPTTNLDNFIPYQQLTEQDVIDLVKNTLGDQIKLKELKAYSIGEEFGLPWITAS